MTTKTRDFPHDPTERERRKNLSEREVKDLELAGGVEGGMQAGSAGGPSGSEDKSAPSGPASEKSRGRASPPKKPAKT